jgi:hypothetical protein
MPPPTNLDADPDGRQPPQSLEFCPICSGPIAEARGMSRCQRCQFSFCASCEGDQHGTGTDENS